MKIFNNILEMIGRTPLVKLNNINEGSSIILAKIEYFNPTGSIKDRAAYYMIKKAQDEGKIAPKKTLIIEPTSGNTGIGLAMVCAVLGYELILTMPESMTKERRDILKAYGAKLALTPTKDGMQGAVDEALRLQKENPNSFIPQQFENPNNPLAHYENTAQEIYIDTDKKVDIVIAGVGTGGSISGIGKYLKEQNKDIKIIAIEPFSSPLISKGYAGSHKIQGIGANFIPKNYQNQYVDEILCVNDDDAIQMMKKLSTKEGIFAGISSGASIYIANELSKKEENKDKVIVTILPDSGMRYLSSNIY